MAAVGSVQPILAYLHVPALKVAFGSKLLANVSLHPDFKNMQSAGSVAYDS